jgi:hypothetical protein
MDRYFVVEVNAPSASSTSQKICKIVKPLLSDGENGKKEAARGLQPLPWAYGRRRANHRKSTLIKSG